MGLNQPGLFKQLPSASKTSFAKPCLESTGPTSQSTTMSAPSQQIDLEELTSSRAASPANLGPKPGSSEARKMTAISGRKWLALLESYGLNISLRRTCADLLTNAWGSSAAFLIWKASATKPSHLLFQLAVSMPRTDGTGFGLWLTPLVSDSEKRGIPKVGGGLAGQVQLWPTPQAWDGKRGARKPDGKRGMALSDLSTPQMWPTVAAREHEGANSEEHLAKARGHHDQLPNAVKMAGHKGGQLNPTWVEWLMGYPEGWTDLGPWETPSSHKSSQKSGGPSSQRRAKRDEH